ncbi:MAG TPA: hypothetical protein VLZ75_09020 [Chitinophagales bacterium]|nr:hypothetical protein [Chitinophagales bacterium]
MQDTVLIKLTNKKAIKLLQEMEQLNLIEVLKQDTSISEVKLSDKYKNVFSKEDAKSFNKNSQEMREEWENI